MLSPPSNTSSPLTIAPFLTSTFALFCDAPPTIAQWTHDGRALIIYDLHYFAQELLMEYFGHCNIVEFVRQLDAFGFRKFKSELGSCQTWEFFHPYFLRDQPHLLHRVHREENEDYGLTGMQSEMYELSDQVAQLTALVAELTRERRCSFAIEATTSIHADDVALLEEVYELLELPQQPLTVEPTTCIWD